MSASEHSAKGRHRTNRGFHRAFQTYNLKGYEHDVRLRSMPASHLHDLYTRQHVDEVTVTYDFRLPAVDLSVLALNARLYTMVYHPVRANPSSLAVRIFSRRKLNRRQPLRGLASEDVS